MMFLKLSQNKLLFYRNHVWKRILFKMFSHTRGTDERVKHGFTVAPEEKMTTTRQRPNILYQNGVRILKRYLDNKITSQYSLWTTLRNALLLDRRPRNTELPNAIQNKRGLACTTSWKTALKCFHSINEQVNRRMFQAQERQRAPCRSHSAYAKWFRDHNQAGSSVSKRR